MKKIAHLRVGYFFVCTVFLCTAGVALVRFRFPHFGFSDFSRSAFPDAATVSHYSAAHFLPRILARDSHCFARLFAPWSFSALVQFDFHGVMQ
ncbi:hypothetical protein [Janthinobacterium sp. SUN120]|uniref:hypothetical protein n=1 Tax=Janthinobacterium sp. SUN120 TaxID=3004099 RepID=UPI0025B172CF|nr:hypothetical protein [Janthinobacterium sp. SUN120]MDN2715249.1 hypothetical protein [Janthinobacterium sp. SUN120]